MKKCLKCGAEMKRYIQHYHLQPRKKLTEKDFVYYEKHHPHDHPIQQLSKKVSDHFLVPARPRTGKSDGQYQQEKQGGINVCDVAAGIIIGGIVADMIDDDD